MGTVSHTNYVVWIKICYLCLTAKSGFMKLSKDQKRLIKSVAMYTGIFIVVFPLMTLVAGRSWTWGEFFIFAGVAVVIFGLVGLLYVLGSHVPEKKDK